MSHLSDCLIFFTSGFLFGVVAHWFSVRGLMISETKREPKIVVVNDINLLDPDYITDDEDEEHSSEDDSDDWWKQSN